MTPMSRAAVAAFAIAFSISTAALADDDDYPSWRPNSPEATSTTGPVILLPNRLHAGNANIPLKLDSSVPDFKPGQKSIPARIYAVMDKSNPVLLNGNKLCDAPPTWIVVVPQPPLGLEIDAFSSAEKPATAASPGLCKTFAYTR